MALMQCGRIETNDNVRESNGHRVQDKDERERGRERTGLSLISSMLTYIMHRDTSAFQHLLIDSGLCMKASTA